MGGSMSSVSLYRNVAIVEIITSLVITIFGVNTFVLFQEQDDRFQTEKEMIFYSSIIAVVQSLLTILSSLFLVGCNQRRLKPSVGVQWTPAPVVEDGEQEPEQPPPLIPQSQLRYQNSLRRKVVAPTWLSWTLCSIASLLFVFIAPIHYCIQSKSDMDKSQQLPHDTADRKYIGLCYSEADSELMPMRSSLRDLYSFSFISIMFKALFVLMVYRNWKHELERAKKVIIYVARYNANAGGGFDGSTENNSPATEPKIIVSSFGDDGGDCEVEVVTGGGGDADDGISKKKKGAELDDDLDGIKK